MRALPGLPRFPSLRALRLFPIALLALAFALAGAGFASAAYAFEKWEDSGVDLLHAGSPFPEATYAEIMGSGACVLDYDADGWEDLLLVNSRYADPALQASLAPRSALYRNLEGARFERVPGALETQGWLMGCAAGDYDGDDDVDVAFTGWGGSELWRNDGGGVFANVTAQAGIAHTHCFSVTCFGVSLAWLDYDLDADLDLYVTNYVAWDGEGMATPNAYPGQCNVMWRNEGAGVFVDATEQTATADCARNHLALAIADVNDDGRQDIFIASDETSDTLLLGGETGFTDATTASGLGDLRGGMGAAWGDYDGDGLLDLAITHFEGERFALYRQGPGLTWTDRAGLDGLEGSRGFVGWGTEWLDYDADGDVDLLAVNGHVNVSYGGIVGYPQRNVLYRNDGGALADATDAWKPTADFGVSRGLAVADFDRDGYLDVVVTNNANETASLHRSERGANNYLSFRLDGGGSVNPHALGAKIEILAAGKVQRREVVASASYLSQSTRDLHFGLGGATRADRVLVEWPDGTTQELADVTANRLLSLSPGGALVPLAERPLASAPRVVEGNRVDPVTLAGAILRGANASESWTALGETTAGREATRSFPTLGSYDATYRIEEPGGAWDEARVEVRIANLPPAPEAAIPTAIDRLAPARFDASASTDRDGRIVSWSWLIEGRPYSGVAVEHRFASSGPTDVALEVVDDEGARATRTFRVTVANAAPVARAGEDLAGNAATTFAFDGSASSDPDGEVVAWRWDFGDGATATGPTAAHRFTADGAYTVTLTVTDDEGATGADTLLVRTGNQYPVARAGGPYAGTRIAPVVLDARESADDEGIVAWQWDFGDGQSGIGPVAEHTYADLGTFEPTLLVVDAQGLSATHTTIVTIVNVAPRIGAGDALAQEGLAPVAFAAEGGDPDGKVVAWRWETSDGGLGEGPAFTRAFPAYGRYQARLRATDEDGATGEATRDVWLYAKPVARAGGDREATRIADVAFDGRASADADGRVVRWRWDFGDGSFAEGPRVAHRYATLGKFAATLTVTDDDGFESSATVAVTVVNLPPVLVARAWSLANVGQLLEWDATASFDPDGVVAATEWTFEGATEARATVQYAFATSGPHEALVRVTDNEGATTERELAVNVVTWLSVRVAMDRAQYAPTEQPRGVVTVRFANGLPAAGALVSVEVQYRVTPSFGPPATVDVAHVTGTAGADGRFSFEVSRALTALPAPLFAPSAGAWAAPDVPSVSHYRVKAEATWGANDGVAFTRYEVGVGGGLATG